MLWAYDYEGEGIKVSGAEPQAVATIPIDHFDGLDRLKTCRETDDALPNTGSSAAAGAA